MSRLECSHHMRFAFRTVTALLQLSLLRASSLLLATLALMLVASAPARAQPPVIDGNLADLIAFLGTVHDAGGCGLLVNDREQDVNQGPVSPYIPCPPVVSGYFENGFDLNLAILAYDRTNQTLYLGVRVAGIIGDSDGNGNASTSGGPGCSASENVVDPPGIGADEQYAWSFDLDGDGIVDGYLVVESNTVSSFGFPGSPSGIFATLGSELEVQFGPVALPLDFSVKTLIGSAFDGLAEDLAHGEESTSFVPCGEPPTPTQTSTWGYLKSLYR